MNNFFKSCKNKTKEIIFSCKMKGKTIYYFYKYLFFVYLLRAGVIIGLNSYLLVVNLLHIYPPYLHHYFIHPYVRVFIDYGLCNTFLYNTIIFKST